MLPFLGDVLMAIDRTHGRLGKHLIAQFLCGSNNAKVQKLRLHRLSGFGALEGLRHSDATSLIDAFLQAGLLQQQEVNRNRPTVCLSEEVQRGTVSRQSVLASVRLPAPLAKRLETLRKNASEPAAATAAAAAAPAAAANARPEETRSPAASPTRIASAASGPAHVAAAAAPPAPPAPLQAATAKGPAVAADVSASDRSAADRSAAANETTEDWCWTWQLFDDGYSWTQIMAIRRKDDLEVANDLQQALRHSKSVQRAWLVAAHAQVGDEASVGQQRLLRELQRRSAAGVG
jgi:ATP-dependent DNA helicase RecQ